MNIYGYSVIHLLITVHIDDAKTLGQKSKAVKNWLFGYHWWYERWENMHNVWKAKECGRLWEKMRECVSIYALVQSVDKFSKREREGKRKKAIFYGYCISHSDGDNEQPYSRSKWKKKCNGAHRMGWRKITSQNQWRIMRKAKDERRKKRIRNHQTKAKMGGERREIRGNNSSVIWVNYLHWLIQNIQSFIPSADSDTK